MEEKKSQERNTRTIKRIDEHSELTEIVVDWDKLPCRKCERRYHFCCPRPDCWNKDGKYCVY